MLYAVVSLISIVLGFVGFAWYNARKTAVAESLADAERQARVEADARQKAMEEALLRNEAEARSKDEREGSEIVSRDDAAAAADFLRDSFPPRPQ